MATPEPIPVSEDLRARIEKLERQNKAQQMTIAALTNRVEQNQIGSKMSSFAIFNQNLELESIVNRKTQRLRSAVCRVEELHNQLLERTKEVEEREEQTRLIVDAFPAPMCVLDRNLKIVGVNEAWREGSRQEHSLFAGIDAGQSYDDVLEHEFRENGSKLAESIRQMVEKDLGTFTQTVPFHKDGGTHWISVRARRVTDGSFTRVVVAHVDMTDRIEASRALQRERELLELVLHNIPHAVYWKDRDGTYLGCNQAYADLIGVDRPANVIGRTNDEIEEIESKSAVEDFELMDRVETALDKKIVVEEGLERREIIYSKVPLLDVEGACEGILAIFADISDVTDLERQLEQARRLESIGQLAAGIAHEINTPMQYVGDNLYFITMATNLLLQLVDKLESAVSNGGAISGEDLEKLLKQTRISVLRTRLPDSIESSKEGVEAVTKIVNAMKGFAHPGGTEMKRASINESIEATLAVAKNEWKYVAEVELDLDENLPAVECDIAEINQVLLNLIVNASHAVAARHADADQLGRIQISTSSTDDSVRLEIQDDGTGIAPEHIERVFDQFFTTKEVGKGTGQGLAIARAAIERHHGNIRCRSKVGVGTTFEITLPIDQPVDESTEPPTVEMDVTQVPA